MCVDSLVRSSAAAHPAVLLQPVNRGFDQHFGFLKGGEDHYSQGSGSSNHEGLGTVDLWEVLLNRWHMNSCCEFLK